MKPWTGNDASLLQTGGCMQTNGQTGGQTLPSALSPCFAKAMLSIKTVGYSRLMIDVLRPEMKIQMNMIVWLITSLCLLPPTSVFADREGSFLQSVYKERTMCLISQLMQKKKKKKITDFTSFLLWNSYLKCYSVPILQLRLQLQHFLW